MRELIERKIDRIRQEPEHVRIRYVWGAVLVVMVLVFSLWIVTLRDSFRSTDTSDTETLKSAVPSSLKGLEEDGQSIKRMIDDAKSLSEEGMTESAQDASR